MAHELVKVGSTTDTEYLTAGEDILVIVPEKGFKDSPAAARVNMDFQTDYARKLGRRCGVVVVMSNLLSQDAESRRIYQEGMNPQLFFGTALVVGNPLSRAIGSFFMGLSKPPVPLTLVNSVEVGIEWLEALKKE
jgi:hypothetical protein